MRLVLFTILVVSLPAVAESSNSTYGQTDLSSMETSWGRNKDSFVRDNDHERVKQLVDNLLKNSDGTQNEEKSFPQADSSK